MDVLIPHAKHKSRYDPPANHLSITPSLEIAGIDEPELFIAFVTVAFANAGAILLYKSQKSLDSHGTFFGYPNH